MDDQKREELRRNLRAKIHSQQISRKTHNAKVKELTKMQEIIKKEMPQNSAEQVINDAIKNLK